MFRIRRFGVVKTANLAAVMYVFIILIVVIPIGLIAVLAGAGGGGAGRDLGGVAAGGGILVFGAIAAVFYGIFGWIFTALFCLVYNFVAGWTGGIEVQVERVEPEAPQLPASWGPGGPSTQQSGVGPGAPPSQPPGPTGGGS